MELINSGVMLFFDKERLFKLFNQNEM